VTVGALPKVDADPVLITQAFDNLINNALKYVEPGAEPRVTISAEQDGDLVCVSIADEGIGIPEHELDAIFDEFHRGRAAEYDGTGLGLSIVKRAIMRHGGSVRARPNSGGKGLVIEARLPAS
jgi:signal transduction histidine kinase